MTASEGHGEEEENLLFGLRKLHFTHQKVNFSKIKFKFWGSGTLHGGCTKR